MNSLVHIWDVLKGNSLTFLTLVFGLLAPIQFILMLVAFFIIADTLFGIYAAKKVKERISSKKMAQVISKMLVYQLVVITVFALDSLLLGEFLSYIISIDLLATKVVALALIFVEIFSIDENLKKMNKGNGIWFYLMKLLNVAKLIKKHKDELSE